MSDIQRLAQRVAALELAMRSTVTRGQVSAVRFAGNRALLQIQSLAGEALEGVELLQPYGLSAHPPSTSEVLILPVLGERDLAVAIAGDALAAGVPGLAVGELGLGDGVAWVSVQADGVHIHAGGRNVIVDDAINVTVTASGTIALNGNVQVDGDLTIAAGTGANINVTGTAGLTGALNIVGSATLNGLEIATV